jgi:hypothetical protein
MENQKEKIQIENWHFSMVGGPYQAPELHEAMIIGTDDDGVLVRVLCRKVLYRDGEELVTSTKIITLGEPNPEYEKEFPDAKGRILMGFPSQPRWRSVKDELPRPWIDVLVVNAAKKVRISYIGRYEIGSDRCKWVPFDDSVTHWMPIPEPPDDSQGDVESQESRQ